MVEVAFVGTMVVSLLVLAGLFAVLNRSRYTVPLAQPAGAPAGAADDTVGQWARRLDTAVARIVAFVGGGVAFAVAVLVASAAEYSVFPIGAFSNVLVQLGVAFVIGGAVLAASLYLVTAEEGAATYSLAFVYITLGVAMTVVLLLAGSAPLTNPVLFLAAFVVLFGFLYGVYTMGRGFGDGHASAVLVTATTLFVLVVLGITVQLLLSS